MIRASIHAAHSGSARWPRTKAPKAGAIYWFYKGELRTLYSQVSIPNSICFSPDGATAYFTGLTANVIQRVDCDPATGLPHGELDVFADTRRSDGWVDGSVVDADGVLWNARWGGARVDAWSPDGKLIRSIAVPAKQSSCTAFVGPNASRIAVTSAWKGMDAASPRRRSRGWQDVPARHRGARPLRA